MTNVDEGLADRRSQPLDDGRSLNSTAGGAPRTTCPSGRSTCSDNPLLRTPLSRDDVKPRLLGHWGTTPGLNFLYAHLNRAIKEREQSTIYITGPGHGGPGLVANAYLDGTYSEVYPDITQDAEGMRRLFRQFSFPGGIPSHVAPETPGSIHEGGELGYALSHAYGAAFDNPDLLVAAVVGDGEAETGALATSWHSNKFVNPAKDGVVLPILHLNGYKIANPTVLARIPAGRAAQPDDRLRPQPVLLRGRRRTDGRPSPTRTGGSPRCSTTSSTRSPRSRPGPPRGDERRPRWPMIVFRTPKGWTGPAYIDGKKTTGSWRAHQVPLASARDTPEHLQVLADWLASYRADELFDEDGKLDPDIAALAPTGHAADERQPARQRRPAAARTCGCRTSATTASTCPPPARTIAEATRVLGHWLTEVIRLNPDNFRIFGPDETASNRLQSVFDATDKQWNAEFFGPEVDEHLARAGRVVEMLSEHQCQGWLEGYLLTGRHGLFNCYEAFIHIIDSMFNQHAKWLKVTNHIPWRRPIASLNYLLSSHVWRQDHNGFSHQDPGFIDHVVNKRAEVVRVYLPPDANTLLSTYDHCLRSRQYVNVVVAGKQPHPNFLTMERGDRALHPGTRASGSGRAPRQLGEDPDVVIAAAGDVPTLEGLAAVDLLRQHLPDLKVRFVNVVDLMRLQDETEHPHGLSNRDFDMIFTRDKPVIFAYHGYPWLIHRLTYRRTGHNNIHVRGYKEEGTTTTPFDMVMLNDLDRYHLVIDVIDRVPFLQSRRARRCASRWSTSGSRPASTPASTATTSPRCATGCGRMPAGRRAGSDIDATAATGGDNE